MMRKRVKLAQPMHDHTTSSVAFVLPTVREEWRARFPTISSLARIGAIAIVGLLLLPYALVLVYRFVDPPISSFMARKALAGTSIEQTWVPLDEISRNLVRMVVVSEDSAFCEHRGVDWRAVKDAVQTARERDIPRGASTIPMQVAKNLFLWPGQTYFRKALEVPIAYFISLTWPKRRVIEVYLNIAEWGPGVFGAEAAARHHFGRRASDLTIGEAALLAASLPNPIVRKAGKPGPGVSRLASRLQARFRRESASAAACIFS